MKNTLTGLAVFGTLVGYKALLLYFINKDAKKEKNKDVVDYDLYKAYKDYMFWKKD